MGRSMRDNSRPFGFAEMLRDVLVTSMSRGQFPFALLGLIVLVILVKMPSADVSALVFRILELVSHGDLVGTLAAISLAAGWRWHARYLRRRLSEESRKYLSASAALPREVPAADPLSDEVSS
jgi:hypothetical protein